jgi:transposase
MLLFMKACPIHLTVEEESSLNSWARNGKTEQRLAMRARIILAAAKGEKNINIAKALSIRTETVSKWRGRFAEKRLPGLMDAPRSGKPFSYDQDTESRILSQLDQSPPSGYARWNGRLLAAALGDVSKYQVWRTLATHGISLQRRRSWCISTDPEFARKAADIVGLYLDPPEHAVVICVDEKPQIQALERAQGWLKLPNGQALTGFSHGYKRHGTTTLFSALEVVTGQIKNGHYQRRRRVEFLDFMNGIVADYPDQEIHVILDNLNTHKPKRDMWLKMHPQVHFHFTPTYASWLNQCEIWFSILERGALHGGNFTRPQQVREAIDNFTEAYNPKAAPFQWTKRYVYAKPLKQSYADLCN